MKRQRNSTARDNAGPIAGDPAVDAALSQLADVLAEIAANPQELESGSSADMASTAKSAGKKKRGAAN